MRIGTANIKNFPDMPKRFVMADAAEMSEETGILGCQEIEGGEDNGPVLRALGDDWKAYHSRKHNPIYLAGRWKGFDGKVHHVNRTGFHQTPKNSYITSVAVVEAKPGRGLPEFAVVNCHMIVGGFNGKNPLKIRRIQWYRELRWLRKVIRYHVRKGRTVFVTGDFNRRNCPPIYKGLRWLTNGGIDYIGVVVVPGSVGITDVTEQKINLHSDHNGRVVKGSLFVKKN